MSANLHAMPLNDGPSQAKNLKLESHITEKISTEQETKLCDVDETLDGEMEKPEPLYDESTNTSMYEGNDSTDAVVPVGAGDDNITPDDIQLLDQTSNLDNAICATILYDSTNVHNIDIIADNIPRIDTTSASYDNKDNRIKNNNIACTNSTITQCTPSIDIFDDTISLGMAACIDNYQDTSMSNRSIGNTSMSNTIIANTSMNNPVQLNSAAAITPSTDMMVFSNNNSTRSLLRIDNITNNINNHAIMHSSSLFPNVVNVTPSMQHMIPEGMMPSRTIIDNIDKIQQECFEDISAACNINIPSVGDNMGPSGDYITASTGLCTETGMASTSSNVASYRNNAATGISEGCRNDAAFFINSNSARISQMVESHNNNLDYSVRNMLQNSDIERFGNTASYDATGVNNNNMASCASYMRDDRNIMLHGNAMSHTDIASSSDNIPSYISGVRVDNMVSTASYIAGVNTRHDIPTPSTASYIRDITEASHSGVTPTYPDDGSGMAMSDCSTDLGDTCCTQRSCEQIEDLLNHFGTFFCGRFENELTTFRESMYELLSEQQKHLSRILLPSTDFPNNSSDLCSEDSGTQPDYCTPYSAPVDNHLPPLDVRRQSEDTK